MKKLKHTKAQTVNAKHLTVMGNFLIKNLGKAFLLLLLMQPLLAASKNNENTTRPSNWPQAVLAGCTPAKSSTDFQVNNVRALIHTGGDMWWDLVNTPRYEIPKGSGKHALFAGALWLGGQDINGQLKIAAMRFRNGIDYWTGPLTKNSAEIDANTCAKWDKHFFITRAQVDEFIAWYNTTQTPDTEDDKEFEGYKIPDIILNWPAHGDVSVGQDYYLAPFFDRNNDGTYNPYDGDYPLYDVNNSINCKTDRTERLYGDQTLWWIFNDKGNVHTETGGSPIGMEIHAQAFAFATNDEINNMTFYNYRLINRSTFTLTNTYFGVWTDADLGFSNDDYVGCDVQRGLGYCYNGREVDGTGGPDHYGNQPPAVGVDFFEGPYQDNDGIDNAVGIGLNEALNGIGYGDGIVDNERFGMRRFLYFDRLGSAQTNDPATAADYYNYLRSFWKDGTKMIYGGNGHISDPNADINTPCDFMFPADTDQEHHWGTGGKPMPFWSEESAGNVPSDRRFVQSAGPFTLTPGAVNDITVGVVWARATSGGPFQSVRLLREIDDKAQALFENCFRVLNGPDAPVVKIVELNKELILHLSNPAGSNNYNEKYEEIDPQIPEFSVNSVINYVLDPLTGQYNPVTTIDTIVYDRKYRFQGYQIFQLKDATVSVDELYNPDRARLIAQCDIKDSVSQLVNFEFVENLNASMPQEMVKGENKGIRHSFRITEDKFAVNDKRLVNHKTYYYMAVAYGFNRYKEYNPNDPLKLDGQKKPYKQGRKSLTGSIRPYSGIPHITSPGGLQINSEYGEGPEITRLEGTGNGGRAISMTLESELKIMSAAPWKVEHPTYKKGEGPVNVYVVDPLSVPAADFKLKFDVIGNGIDSSKWTLANLSNGEIVKSEQSITVGNEQIIPKWGLAVFIEQAKNAGKQPLEGNGYISSSIIYEDAGKRWLSGVSDADACAPNNWIRSGTFSDPNNSSCNDFPNKDPQEVFEKVVNGWFAPYSLTSYIEHGPALNALTVNLANLNLIKSVDIVITNDKSKWTRCCVIENQFYTALAEGGAKKNGLRKAPSKTKRGMEDPSGTIGMSWFPGYAICQETGERLNMAFSEDSWLAAENGRDMLWNPTANLSSTLGSPLFGGKHFIYVFDHSGNGPNDMPAYDEGKWMHEKLMTGNSTDERNVWRTCMWVGWPILAPNEKFMSADVRISIKVNREYAKYDTGSNENETWPLYTFSTKDMAVIKSNKDLAKDALELINVVPNPYYAFSEYEKNQLDNRIKIVNLPQECQISIYTMNGVLVRKFNKADPKTSIDWDLRNHASIPIASGIYLIHVSVPDVGEKVLKWYGVLRPIDLDSF
jgi:hypothetical protein